MISSRELERKILDGLHRSAEKVTGKSLDRDAYGIQLESPKNDTFGDLSANFPLRLAKEMKAPPREVAERIVSGAGVWSGVESFVKGWRVEGPGYINITLSSDAWALVIREILGSDTFGKGEKKPGRTLLEYVSANPTGPLTVAHGRQAALGDVLARVLRHAGHEVDTEYYNNDEGVQINTLGESLLLRYREQRGEKIEMPENSYRGAYLADIARALKEDADAGKVKFPANPKEQAAFCSRYARDAIIETIVKDLQDFGVEFGHYYSQEELGRSGLVERTLEELKETGHVYESEGAVWFRSTTFGDDKDRVLVKSDKNYTYLTPDIAYHHDKFNRGYARLINIWGPDHHGYIPRIKASQTALGHDADAVRIQIAQLVTLYKGKEQVRMSTRAGEFVTLREIIDEVGKDAGRFFFCMRKFDSHLDFDMELAKKQAPENPVYYIQYAHARISSIKKMQDERGVKWDPKSADLALLKEPEELRLMKAMRQFPRAVSAAARDLEPSVLVEYLGGLAAAFHQFYGKCRVVTDDAALTQSRLTLVYAMQKLVRTGLGLLGISAPESM